MGIDCIWTKIPPCSSVERDESSFQQRESMFGGKAETTFERKKNNFFEIIAATTGFLCLNGGGCPVIKLFQGCLQRCWHSFWLYFGFFSLYVIKNQKIFSQSILLHFGFHTLPLLCRIWYVLGHSRFDSSPYWFF